MPKTRVKKISFEIPAVQAIAIEQAIQTLLSENAFESNSSKPGKLPEENPQATAALKHLANCLKTALRHDVGTRQAQADLLRSNPLKQAFCHPGASLPSRQLQLPCCVQPSSQSAKTPTEQDAKTADEQADSQKKCGSPAPYSNITCGEPAEHLGPCSQNSMQWWKQGASPADQRNEIARLRAELATAQTALETETRRSRSAEDVAKMYCEQCSLYYEECGIKLPCRLCAVWNKHCEQYPKRT